MFQKLINREFALGVIGDIYYEGPRIAHTKQLNTTVPTNNVIGRVVTQSTTNVDQMQAGGDGVILGVLSHSKQYALYGTAADHLAPTITLPNLIQAEYIAMGNIIIQASTALVSNDPTLKLYFEDATGIIGQAASVPADHTELPNARVYLDVESGAPGVIVFDEAH